MGVGVVAGQPSAAIPPFNCDGLLPPGDYPVTLDGLEASYLVTGAGVQSTGWDVAWRRYLVGNVRILVDQLWRVGIDDVYINGSFVEDKDHPNDIDGYFDCDLVYLATGALERDLNALDPFKVWTWDQRSRRPDRNSAKAQLPMWHIYRVELYPHIGQPSGILDQHGNPRQFPAAFRRTRCGDRPKGIIRIVR
jgi:hypothetical protein